MTVSMINSTTEITFANMAPPESETMLAIATDVNPEPVTRSATVHTNTAAKSCSKATRLVASKTAPI